MVAPLSVKEKARDRYPSVTPSRYSKDGLCARLKIGRYWIVTSWRHQFLKVEHSLNNIVFYLSEIDMGVMRTITCIQCGTTLKKENAKKYCSHKCQQDYQWENIKKPNLLKGIGGSRCTFKRYLIEEYGGKCSECGISNEWNNKSLSLHLDHIDGNSDNDSLDNLRLLCPNCHSQTETYGSKGYGNKVKKQTKRNSYLREYKGYE